MVSILIQAYDLFCWAIYPPFCALCRTFLNERSVLCEPCRASVKPIVSVETPVTRSVSMRVHAIGDYRDPLRAMILAKGWSNRVVATQLGQLLWDLTCVKHLPCDYLVPIPLHWRRYASRGYNQAEVMAQEIARLHGSAPVVDMLKRVKHTAPQSQFTADGRQENLHGVFALRPGTDASTLRGKHVVFVDDLMTTGATLQAAAKVVRRFKPASMRAVVACRVV